uniref:Uncharacterized protein n=1 Tax=Aegilops tauschii subsp. strangulata TaxID=200361 RepID=A0A453H3V0_AEGTS
MLLVSFTCLPLALSTLLLFHTSSLYNRDGNNQEGRRCRWRIQKSRWYNVAH